MSLEERGGTRGGDAFGPVFSVVMPVHDKERHVEAAIRSVLAQTFDRFELIVVDDASSDGSRAVIASIESPRMRVLERDQPGPGGYAARNMGISEARGDWVTFLDADDAWAPDRLERLWEAILAFPDAKLHTSAWYVATRDGRVRLSKYARRHGARGEHELTLADYLHAIEGGEPPIHTDTMAIRVDALDGSEVFPASQAGRRGGDVFAWLRLMSREKRLVWSPNVGARYYVDSDNMVTRKEPSTAAFLTARAVASLEVGLTKAERSALRRAVNRMLWDAWLRNSLRGQQGFSLVRRLLWRGTGPRTWVRALVGLTPLGVMRLIGTLKGLIMKWFTARRR